MTSINQYGIHVISFVASAYFFTTWCDMILFKRRFLSFPWRLLGVILHPGLLLLPSLSIFLVWLGHRDPALSGGFYMASVILMVMYIVALYLLVRRLSNIIVSIEADSSNLIVRQSDMKGLQEFVVPANKLEVDLVVRTGRKRSLYLLTVRSKADPAWSATLDADPQTIGFILNGIESQKLVDLPAEEKKFAAEYRSNVAWESSNAGKTLKYAIWLALFGFVGYSLYQCKDAISTVYHNLSILQSPVAGLWHGEVGKQSYDLDLLTDSTLHEYLFGQSGKWSYRPDSLTGPAGTLTLCNTVGNCLTFLLAFPSADSMRLSNGDVSITLTRRADRPKDEVIDSLKRFIQTFESWPVPVSREAMRPFLLLANHNFQEPPDPLRALWNDGQLFVGWMTTDRNDNGEQQINANRDFAVVWDMVSRKRITWQEFTSACGDNLNVLERNGKPVLVHAMDCEENGKNIRSRLFYEIDPSGRLKVSDGHGLQEKGATAPNDLIGIIEDQYRSTSTDETMSLIDLDVQMIWSDENRAYYNASYRMCSAVCIAKHEVWMGIHSDNWRLQDKPVVKGTIDSVVVFDSRLFIVHRLVEEDHASASSRIITLTVMEADEAKPAAIWKDTAIRSRVCSLDEGADCSWCDSIVKGTPVLAIRINDGTMYVVDKTVEEDYDGTCVIKSRQIRSLQFVWRPALESFEEVASP